MSILEEIETSEAGKGDCPSELMRGNHQAFMIDALKNTIKRRIIRTILIKDEAAFNAFYRELQDAMTKAWDQGMRSAIVNGLDRLKDLSAGTGGSSNFTAADKALIMGAMAKSVGADAITALMRDPVIKLSDGLYRLGFHEVGKASGIDLAFMRPDLDALDIIQSGNLYWVGKSWDVMTQTRINNALTQYFKDGMTRDGLMERFTHDFADIANKGKPYWAIMADHTATKTREMGRVAGYMRANISHVQIRAHLDDNTTSICRAMNGRIIAVDKMRQQRDNYLNAMQSRNEGAAKKAWAMHPSSDASRLSGLSTAKLPKDTANPPYHFRCRTITVAYFMDEEGELGAWKRKTNDRIPLAKKDIEAIIEKAKSAKWPHAKMRGWHFNRHKGEFGFTSHTQYSQSAIDLIRSGNRDLHLAIRKGDLDAVFARQGKNIQTGKDGYFMTIIDIQNNKIRSHYHRRNLNSNRDQVQNVLQPARGIRKWLIN